MLAENLILSIRPSSPLELQLKVLLTLLQGVKGTVSNNYWLHNKVYLVNYENQSFSVVLNYPILKRPNKKNTGYYFEVLETKPFDYGGQGILSRIVATFQEHDNRLEHASNKQIIPRLAKKYYPGKNEEDNSAILREVEYEQSLTPKYLKTKTPIKTATNVFLVMRFLEGIALDKLYHQITFWSPLALIQFFINLTNHYIEDLFKVEVIHRDLKMENILVNGLQPQIVDFGLSKKAGTAPFKENVGTYGFTAPEVLFGAIGTVKCDIFSLACIFAALLGDPWFRIIEHTRDEVLVHLAMYKNFAFVCSFPGLRLEAQTVLTDLVIQMLNLNADLRPEPDTVRVMLSLAQELQNNYKMPVFTPHNLPPELLSISNSESQAMSEVLRSMHTTDAESALSPSASRDIIKQSDEDTVIIRSSFVQATAININLAAPASETAHNDPEIKHSKTKARFRFMGFFHIKRKHEQSAVAAAQAPVCVDGKYI